jgi:phenylalanyl-tRNA synthetase alpha chain
VNVAVENLEVQEGAILADIAAAGDEPALEAVRVAALGKKGSVSELLKSLGSMTPEERQSKGPAINGLKNRVTEAIAAVDPRCATWPSSPGSRPRRSM